MADIKRQCDLQIVSDAFSHCLKDDMDILIDPFLVGYDELGRYDRRIYYHLNKKNVFL